MSFKWYPFWDCTFVLYFKLKPVTTFCLKFQVSPKKIKIKKKNITEIHNNILGKKCT